MLRLMKEILYRIKMYTSGAKVAVLGPTTRDDLFGVGATDVVGQIIRINGMEFNIIGITVSKGGSGFSNADDVIYIPYTTAQQISFRK